MFKKTNFRWGKVHPSFYINRLIRDFMTANIIASLQKNKLYRPLIAFRSIKSVGFIPQKTIYLLFFKKLRPLHHLFSKEE